MFLALLIFTGLIAAGALVVAYTRARDIFHPLVIIGPMMLALYVILPLKLWHEDSLASFFSEEDLFFVALVNLLGVACFCWGSLAATGRKRIPLAKTYYLSKASRQRVYLGGVVLGIIGLGAYAATIINVGGFYQAYSQAYSGGWSESGYIRDAVSLCIPAIVFILLSRTENKLSWRDLLFCFAFASPFFIQGLLGARRGPTFLVFAAAGICWYMVRARRPQPLFFLVAGCGLGLLMLFLVSNRESIYLGSEWNLDKSVFDYLKVENPEHGTGNEYIYGGGTILHASVGEEYYWGRRYFAEVFVRPIPRQLWPNKYEAVGLEQLEQNAGAGGEELLDTIGWSGAFGAAPGMIADLWLEFWWFSLLALYAIGWGYAKVWRLACLKGNFYVVIYVFMASLSIFLIFQTIEAILVRFLFMAGSSWLVWSWAKAKTDLTNEPQARIRETRLG